MRIGLYAYSPRHLCTPVIPHLVRGIRASEPGAVISIRSLHSLAGRISEHDALLVDRKKIAFSAWAARQDAIIWFYRPSEAQRDWAASCGCRQLLLLPWGSIESADRSEIGAIYSGWDGVCAPSYAAEALLSAYFDISPVYVLPWGICIPPITRPPEQNSIINLALLAYGDAKNTPAESIHSLESLLERFSHTRLVILLENRRGRLAREALRLAKRRRDRVIIGHGLAESDRLRILLSVDLALVLAPSSDFCVPLLEAIYMGVPVVTWNSAPATELVIDGLSGRLVQSIVVPEAPGIPRVIPSWLKLEECVAALLQDPAMLQFVRVHTSHGLLARNRIFSNTLVSVLSGGQPPKK